MKLYEMTKHINEQGHVPIKEGMPPSLFEAEMSVRFGFGLSC